MTCNNNEYCKLKLNCKNNYKYNFSIDSATICCNSQQHITTSAKYITQTYSVVYQIYQMQTRTTFAHVHATAVILHMPHGLLDSSTTSIQRVRALLSDSATITNLSTSQITLSQLLQIVQLQLMQIVRH